MKQKQGWFLGSEQESTIKNVISCLIKLTPTVPKLAEDNYSFVVSMLSHNIFMLAPNPRSNSIHFPKAELATYSKLYQPCA